MRAEIFSGATPDDLSQLPTYNAPVARGFGRRLAGQDLPRGYRNGCTQLSMNLRGESDEPKICAA
jgi:hypothetical protein